MNSQEIKDECKLMYAQIKQAEERLRELRSICKHENTHEGEYSWRVGCIDLAIICSDCGTCIKYKNISEIVETTTTK